MVTVVAALHTAWVCWGCLLDILWVPAMCCGSENGSFIIEDPVAVRHVPESFMKKISFCLQPHTGTQCILGHPKWKPFSSHHCCNSSSLSSEEHCTLSPFSPKEKFLYTPAQATRCPAKLTILAKNQTLNPRLGSSGKFC